MFKLNVMIVYENQRKKLLSLSLIFLIIAGQLSKYTVNYYYY